MWPMSRRLLRLPATGPRALAANVRAKQLPQCRSLVEKASYQPITLSPTMLRKATRTLLNEIDLVVYDMAGTTVQEGGIVYKTLQLAMREDGLQVSDEDMHPWHGAKKEAVIEHFALKAGTPPEDITERVTRVGEWFVNAIDDAYFNEASAIDHIDIGLLGYFRLMKIKDEGKCWIMVREVSPGKIAVSRILPHESFALMAATVVTLTVLPRVCRDGMKCSRAKQACGHLHPREWYGECKMFLVDPSKVRFTHGHIHHKFRFGNGLDDTIDQLRHEELSFDDFPPMEVFRLTRATLDDEVVIESILSSLDIPSRSSQAYKFIKQLRESCTGELFSLSNRRLFVARVGHNFGLLDKVLVQEYDFASERVQRPERGEDDGDEKAKWLSALCQLRTWVDLCIVIAHTVGSTMRRALRAKIQEKTGQEGLPSRLHTIEEPYDAIDVCVLQSSLQAVKSVPVPKPIERRRHQTARKMMKHPKEEVFEFLSAQQQGGVRQLKDAGIKIAFDTGYPENIQKGLIKRLGFDKIADAYISSYQVSEGRPYPYMIHHLMERTQVMNVKRVCKVGDSVRDIEEGRNAGCGLVVGVLSGADGFDDLMRAGAHVVCERVTDLPVPRRHVAPDERRLPDLS
ncbi:Phosphonoacetaldehyde hydrolase [Symbiodinium microadriaticum]|uniref:Phosphonoacetaldehyde hydrolase n=1 Tax=Symbiodinium microadriaticum TaxID=2951 RepID=A0A1Q9EE85_SYMMI|nr:Phosphonoacetaldehyde hydrolase [Symbiodinium microadriaticum]